MFLVNSTSDYIIRRVAGLLGFFLNFVLFTSSVAAFQTDSAGQRALQTRQAVDRGSAYLRENRKTEAIREFKRALAIDPQSATAHMLLGYAYRAQGAYEMIGEAKAELQQALALDPTLAWARFYLARIYLDLGRPHKAKEELELALQAHPRVPHFLALLGETNRTLGNPTLAVESNRKALEVDPSFAFARYYLGAAYLDLKNREAAIKELELAVKSVQAVPEMHLKLGSVYLDDRKFDKAVELFRNALNMDGSSAEAHLKLATAYHLQGLLDPALQELRLALGDEKGMLSSPHFQQLRSDALTEMGMVLQKKGLKSQAIEAYAKVLQLDPSNGKAHHHLAVALFEEGKYEKAREHASKAESLGSPVDAALLERITAKSKR